MSEFVDDWGYAIYSNGAGCLEASINGTGLAFGRDEMRSFICVSSRVGDVPFRVGINGALCGNGDISMESFPGPGEEEERGGVVARSIPPSAKNILRPMFRDIALTSTVDCTEKIL